MPIIAATKQHAFIHFLTITTPFYALILHKNTHCQHGMQPETFPTVNYLPFSFVYRRISRWPDAIH
ncbi:hypothetical protein CWN50_38260 [Klebsiella michiganensis]|uniref:Uncharacterized protein n=1 Tax=Klebsiella michiganensis TaxID=1134687 RepID=A0A2J4P3R4_9ENTR|nr:hypothetical protein CWN50_38260 [Klebsiella michiganensis]